MDCSQIARDLRQEQQALDEIVARLGDQEWTLPTPSFPWTIADQIAHLTHFDESAVRAITDPQEFQAEVEQLWMVTGSGDQTVDDLTLDQFRHMPPPQLLDRWRTGRARLAEAAATLTDETRVNWYGPSMGAKSFLTARLMETWAHGQDITDAAGAHRPATDRLQHIARLGFITRAWSYTNRGLDPPSTPVKASLDAPSGDVWTFGPHDALESVTGPGEDFCLVVTQRRHIDDTQLVVTPLAREWLLIGQAFAGPPTDGPATGSRPNTTTKRMTPPKRREHET